jgi:hypothetical protein
LAVVVPHYDRNDFVWVRIKPAADGREIRLECADIQKVARGMAQSDAGRIIRLLGLELHYIIISL